MSEKAKPYQIRVPKDHPVASKMKPGDVMRMHAKMMDPDAASEGEEGTYPMEEESSELHTPTKPAPAAKPKAKGPIEYLRQKRDAAKK